MDRNQDRNRNGVELHGAGKDHLDHISETVMRRRRFPDGVDRLIALPRRYWDAYDEMDRAWGFAGDYEQASLDWAMDEMPAHAPGFEDRVRHFFRLCIQMGWVVYNEDMRGSSNINR